MAHIGDDPIPLGNLCLACRLDTFDRAEIFCYDCKKAFPAKPLIDDYDRCEAIKDAILKFTCGCKNKH